MQRNNLWKFVLVISLFLTSISNVEAEIEGIKITQRQINGDTNKKYWILVPKDMPKEGFGLVVVLAGGDGDGGKVIPFWKNVASKSLDNKYIVALPVAPKWNKDQEIIWPTDKYKDIVKDMRFTTEEFISKLVNDVMKENKINPKYVWLHGVSSGGPAVYAISLSHPAYFKGYYVLSSVFKLDWLPSLSSAKDKRYYIQHSQEDKICPFWMAKKAAFQLGQNGAITELNIFQGPHGYPFKEGHPDWESIKAAFAWLEK